MITVKADQPEYELFLNFDNQKIFEDFNDLSKKNRMKWTWTKVKTMKEPKMITEARMWDYKKLGAATFYDVVDDVDAFKRTKKVGNTKRNSKQA